MDPQALAHISRITDICEGLGRHSAWSDQDCSLSFDRLTTFDADFWTFTRYLSLPLYEETSALLRQDTLAIPEPPTIAVIMAVHRPDPQLLRLAIRSALEQVGVRVHLHLSLDGPEGMQPLVEDVMAELAIDRQQVSLHHHPENRGVGLCRNAALARLQQEWFTFLDCDDIFHPLRLLHAWLALQASDAWLINTSYSRVSLAQRKIVLLQQCLTTFGGNSFLAHRQVLTRLGYLAPLRFWEDTEYQQRLAYFQTPVCNCAAVGHFQNTDLDPGYQSLATRWRQEAHPIEGHPYLCGTVLGDLDDETRAIRDHFLALYPRLDPARLPEIFTPAGTPEGLLARQD